MTTGIDTPRVGKQVVRHVEISLRALDDAKSGGERIETLKQVSYPFGSPRITCDEVPLRSIVANKEYGVQIAPIDSAIIELLQIQVAVVGTNDLFGIMIHD